MGSKSTNFLESLLNILFNPKSIFEQSFKPAGPDKSLKIPSQGEIKKRVNAQVDMLTLFQNLDNPANRQKFDEIPTFTEEDIKNRLQSAWNNANQEYAKLGPADRFKTMRIYIFNENDDPLMVAKYYHLENQKMLEMRNNKTRDVPSSSPSPKNAERADSIDKGNTR